MAASALPHAPFSIALHATIGVSESTRDMLRTLDVFLILTCGGESPSVMQNATGRCRVCFLFEGIDCQREVCSARSAERGAPATCSSHVDVCASLPGSE